MTNQTPANEMRDRYGGEPERILAAQARAYREKLGMTQAEVAREMSARGPAMRQSTIAKIEGGQRPVRVNEAVMLAAVLRVPLADLLAGPGQQDRGDALAAARDEEREMLGQLLQAGRRFEEHRAAHAYAEQAMHEAAAHVELAQARYAEARARAGALAAAANEEGEPGVARGR